MTKPGLSRKSRIQIGWFVCGLSLLLSALLWGMWVMPVSRSVESAEPADLGTPIVRDIKSGETVGIWANGTSTSPRVPECSVVGPDGEATRVMAHDNPSWNGLLGWVISRPRFEQVGRFTAVMIETVRGISSRA